MIGAVIVVAGILTPLFGAERISEVFGWISAQASFLVRFIAILPFGIGLFFAFAINTRRRVTS